MNKYFVDLHVHVGRSSKGKEVKKATANNLTFKNVAYESLRKGIDIIGVVDCISPYILEDINELVDKGEMIEKEDGGIEYKGKQTLLLGAEIETHEKGGGSAHSLCFFPSLKHITAFSEEMKNHIKNIWAFSLMSRLTAQELFDLVEEFGGIYIPAHIFTPHKSFYGNCCESLHEIFDDKSFQKIQAIELGLSADDKMASQMVELDGKSFISNSDAHSLPKIGREYNIFEMEDNSYVEVLKALGGKDGRKVLANYGLNPKLGKYYRSFCKTCDKVIEGEPPVLKCPVSHKHRIVTGVKDRLELIKDREEVKIESRATYHYQIPLQFLPGVGPKTIHKLIDYFGTEMEVIHNANYDELKKVVKENIAKNIVLAREGKLQIDSGGGGVYGRIGTDKT